MTGGWLTEGTVNIIKTGPVKKILNKYSSIFLPTFVMSVFALSFSSNRWCIPALWQSYIVKNQYLKKFFHESFILFLNLHLLFENTSLLVPKVLLLGSGCQNHTIGPSVRSWDIKGHPDEKFGLCQGQPFKPGPMAMGRNERGHPSKLSTVLRLAKAIKKDCSQT